MRTFHFLTLVAVFVTLLSCSSKKEKNIKEKVQVAIVPDCVFPGTEIAAPNWICDEPVSGIEVQAVGVAEVSVAGVSFMKDLAAADARGKIAEQFKVRVQKMVKSYIGTTGANDTETVDRLAESVLKTITNETLVGSKIYRSRTSPDGRMFVLVGLDEGNTQRAAERAVKTSINNEQALWQQFKAKQGFDELAKEISKEKVQ